VTVNVELRSSSGTNQRIKRSEPLRVDVFRAVFIHRLLFRLAWEMVPVRFGGEARAVKRLARFRRAARAFLGVGSPGLS